MKLAPTSSCTACMACIDACHQEALRFEVNRDGFFQINADRDKCIECGLCSKVCPVISPCGVAREDIANSKPYAAWCEDNDLRNKSASGGAFAAVAKEFIARGGIVYGAAIDGFEVHHKRIERIEELPQLLGSKYQHGSMKGIYRLIMSDLRHGKNVLFSGLSCQVAGVRSFVGNKLSKWLYTIDMICGGISTMLPIIRLKGTGRYKGILSYRDKENGWKSNGYQYALKLFKIDGDNLGMNNMMLLCFQHKVTKRPSCLNCQFNGFHRNCDLTIGDFWGENHFPEQHHNGVSIMITHSNRFFDYFNPSSLHIEPALWSDVVRNNPNVYWSKTPLLLKSRTRKHIFQALRLGDYQRVINWMEGKFLWGKVEMSLILQMNNKQRQSYLNRIFK